MSNFMFRFPRQLPDLSRRQKRLITLGLAIWAMALTLAGGWMWFNQSTTVQAIGPLNCSGYRQERNRQRCRETAQNDATLQAVNPNSSQILIYNYRQNSACPSGYSAIGGSGLRFEYDYNFDTDNQSALLCVSNKYQNLQPGQQTTAATQNLGVTSLSATGPTQFATAPAATPGTAIPSGCPSVSSMQYWPEYSSRLCGGGNYASTNSGVAIPSGCPSLASQQYWPELVPARCGGIFGSFVNTFPDMINNYSYPAYSDPFLYNSYNKSSHRENRNRYTPNPTGLVFQFIDQDKTTGCPAGYTQLGGSNPRFEYDYTYDTDNRSGRFCIRDDQAGNFQVLNFETQTCPAGFTQIGGQNLRFEYDLESNTNNKSARLCQQVINI